MDISEEKAAGNKMNHRQAWAHFYAKWRKLEEWERKGVPSDLRPAIVVAQSDYLEKRRNKKGEPLTLGSERVARILLAVSEAMPDVFSYVYHPPEAEWFEVK